MVLRAQTTIYAVWIPSSVVARDNAANMIVVTREDMQCLKNDWLTDNVCFRANLAYDSVLTLS